MIREAIDAIVNQGRSLSEEEAAAVMEEIMSGGPPPPNWRPSWWPCA